MKQKNNLRLYIFLFTCTKEIVLIPLVLLAIDNTKLETRSDLKLLKVKELLSRNLVILNLHKLCIPIQTQKRLIINTH